MEKDLLKNIIDIPGIYMKGIIYMGEKMEKKRNINIINLYMMENFLKGKRNGIGKEYTYLNGGLAYDG